VTNLVRLLPICSSLSAWVSRGSAACAFVRPLGWGETKSHSAPAAFLLAGNRDQKRKGPPVGADGPTRVPIAWRVDGGAIGSGDWSYYPLNLARP
jgi:hypothetical protein